MSAVAIEQRITRYLSEVEENLQDVGAEERRETLRQVEEHLREALRERAGGEPTLADLESVLADMAAPDSYRERGGAPPAPYRAVGWAAVASLAASVFVPILLYVTLRLFGAEMTGAGILLLIGGLFALAALVMGIIAWRAPTGKAAVIGFVVLVAISLLFLPVFRVERRPVSLTTTAEASRIGA